MPLKEGDQILESKYQILRLIGQGATARVWLAEEPHFGNRRVAIKEPRVDLLLDLQQELLRRYDQEIQLAPELQAAGVPNVVPVYTLETLSGGTQLLVMQYMEGGSLADLIAQHKTGLPLDQALAITRDILAALEGFHELPVAPVHRDVKPENILFDGRGRAYLADFGLAQLPGMSGRTQFLGGTHPGTPMYMAPEQESSPRSLMPAADLYALGCVLFEMLTGKRYKRVRPGTAASDLRPEVPAWLDAALARALVEDPWDRYEDAAEMAEALQAGAEGAGREAEARARREAEEQVLPEAKGRAGRLPDAVWSEVAPAVPYLGAGETRDRAQLVPDLDALPRTPSGLVIATPDNLARLLAMPRPPARVWWDKADMEFCLVPAGSFLMGSDDADEEAEDNEKPQRRVHLDAYYLARYPTTQAHYARFVRETGHRVPSDDANWAKPYSWDQARKAPPAGLEDHPVVLVSWDDAVAYCRWAGLRLPTEAEWEKAARGTGGRIYPWGDTWVASRCNSREEGPGGTMPVGAYSPAGDSPYGCADMAGNVSEWCSDWYDKSYYHRSPERNPQGPQSGECRVQRGLSWSSGSRYVRSAYRSWMPPVKWFDNIGFRCSVSTTPSP